MNFQLRLKLLSNRITSATVAKQRVEGNSAEYEIDLM
jgi:hypothetical protein